MLVPRKESFLLLHTLAISTLFLTSMSSSSHLLSSYSWIPPSCIIGLMSEFAEQPGTLSNPSLRNRPDLAMGMSLKMYSFGKLVRSLEHQTIFFPVQYHLSHFSFNTWTIPAHPNSLQAATFLIRTIRVALRPAVDFHT